uniref:Alginate export domain-containing protein n=1 Tax=Candidatus Kentrum sp. FM TaxID=2126340 RepID=A0A450S3X7_9GAMM|nr:MAG: hypothetical protein BECKFM1743A_GA0114220_100379 [Candidatus Kentron sp. FM]VFJ67919.1 MAG: hypothetical protein BECKFM1743C_GA0114222_104712 [Candidatus Kentron sp. FM]VFK07246.1 MAG: hypothetical protein BECKFM1743B_GA0114221_100359 [Candidatus Kentron sp. FM]
MHRKDGIFDRPAKGWRTILHSSVILVLALVIVQAMTRAGAVETRFSGHVEGQLRWFQTSPSLTLLNTSKQSTGGDISFAVQPEWRYQTQDRKHDFSFIPFMRYDPEHDERTHADIRELYWLYNGNAWEVLAGVNQVFWGVAESRHLVDIINQKDVVEDPDLEDKLGQPMIRLTMDIKPMLKLMRILKENKQERRGADWGKLSLFLMPGFRERIFPGADDRLRGPIPVDENEVVYSDGASEDRVDLALRYSRTIGDWEIGLHYFHGNAREPRLVPNCDFWTMPEECALAVLSGEQLRLIPHYERINQAGVDLQYTTNISAEDDNAITRFVRLVLGEESADYVLGKLSGGVLGKFEGIIREGQGDTFGALVAGVEYTKYQVFDSNADLGFLVEYLYDDRDDAPRAPLTPFDHDIFLATRISLNDTKDTHILAGFMTDTENDEYSFNVEAERRVNDNISAELLIRLFGGDEEWGAFSNIKDDDYAQLTFSYHF